MTSWGAPSMSGSGLGRVQYLPDTRSWLDDPLMDCAEMLGWAELESAGT